MPTIVKVRFNWRQLYNPALFFIFSHFIITGSIYAQSVAAARAEQALSDVTSSMSSNMPKPYPAWHVQLKIWLLTGELYVRLGRCEEALACAKEAAALSPASHHVMYLVRKHLFKIACTLFTPTVVIY